MENLMSTITIKKMTPEHKEVWDSFVDDSYNGTIFHKMKFLEYNKAKHEYSYLGAYDADNLVAVLPCVIKDGSLTSPVGASYGGLVLKKTSFIKTNNIVQALLLHCKTTGIFNIKFTHAPIIYSDSASQDIDFILLYNGFKNSLNLFSSVLSIDGNLEANISDAGMRAVRKSKRAGIEVVSFFGTDIEGPIREYHNILVENKLKFGVNPAHSVEELLLLNDMLPSSFTLVAAMYEGKMIGGVYVFDCNKAVDLAFYIASLHEYQHLRPVNLLFYELASKCNKRYLDLGVSMNTIHDNPMEPSWSLISFKEFIGSRGFLRPTYTLTL
jgi:hypothetical protein